MNDQEDLCDKEKQIREVLKGRNIYRWKKLSGELECDNNEETLNKIVKELNKRIEQEKRNGETKFSINRG